MAGLVAAYELKQAGHNVTILEQQTRVGGRVKTFGETDGFAKGLYVDAGAMRLPCKPGDPEKTHFLTDHYATHFKLTLVPFVNYDGNTFLKFYNMSAPIQVKDWKNSYFEILWPGWDRRIKETGAKEKHGIKSINDYFNHTTGIVTDQLRKWLVGVTTEKEAAEIWDRWANIWSQFAADEFLRSCSMAVMTKVPKKWRDGLHDKLQEFLPWPQEAITCYSAFNYIGLDHSLVQQLRDPLGHWWSKSMHHIEGGMSRLPQAFTERNKHGWDKDVHLQKEILFNRTVTDVEYTFHEKNKIIPNHVKVKGYFSTSGQDFEIEGDALIVTTPANILRQIQFRNADTQTPQPPECFYKAIEGIWSGPSTKIMIQTKTRFWESKYDIRGGFSKTDLPIGQIHYPSNRHLKSIPGDKGILLVYTWKSEALLFGSLNPRVAVKEVVKQISTIHPEIEKEFEVGAVQAWYNEPSAQGAYALLKPYQYQNVKILRKPIMGNVYFAGEAISFTDEWIQGALESGLRAAYQFYCRNEHNV